MTHECSKLKTAINAEGVIYFDGYDNSYYLCTDYGSMTITHCPFDGEKL